AHIFAAWAADRAAAAALRPFQATLVVRLPSGEHRRVAPEVPMPPGPYHVTAVDLIGVQRGPNDFVSRVLVPAVGDLAGLETIDRVPHSATVTAEDLNRLADAPAGKTLLYLQAMSCELTSETLAALKRFP